MQDSLLRRHLLVKVEQYDFLYDVVSSGLRAAFLQSYGPILKHKVITIK